MRRGEGSCATVVWSLHYKSVCVCAMCLDVVSLEGRDHKKRFIKHFY